MKQYLKVGLIQPVIDPKTAWGTDAPWKLNIDPITAERVWQEIQAGLILMLKTDGRPDVIVIPELHLPVARISIIKNISKKFGVVVMAGVDFQRNPHDHDKVRNRGIITIPGRLMQNGRASNLITLHFGKTFFTYMERSMFAEGIDEGGVSSVAYPDPEQNMYVFHSSELGDFGIMICSDIFDIERMLLYQGRIHHLFVISLNKDLNTYFAMAESLTRLLYCNVVICNTGQFGGSNVMSPWDNPNERIIYKYQAQRTFNTQLVEIPLQSLDDAQHFDFNGGNKTEAGILFKASPPGYSRFRL